VSEPGAPVTDSVAPPVVRQPAPPPKCPACEKVLVRYRLDGYPVPPGETFGGDEIDAHHELEDDLRSLVNAQSVYIVELVDHLKTHDCEQVLRPVGVKRVEEIDRLRQKVGIEPPKRAR
jgi:hypothetical protein